MSFNLESIMSCKPLVNPDRSQLDNVNINKEVGLSYLKDTIYLDQYANELLTNEKHSVSIFNNTEDKLQLRIVVENNTIYLENNTNLDLKVLGSETNIIFEEHKPEDEFKELEIDDDLSFNNSTKISFIHKNK